MSIRTNRSTVQGEALDARLSSVRVAGLEGLRERCMPSDADVDGSEALGGIRARRSESVFRRVYRSTRLAAAAVLAAGAVWLVWGWVGVSAASARVLQEALDSLGQVRAVCITYDVDSGPGTPLSDEWKMWAARDAGFRFERGQQLEVYSSAQQTQYTYDPAQNQVECMRVSDPLILVEFLRRCEADKNVEELRGRALQRFGGVSDEMLTRDGVSLRRISAVDERGKPISIEIDAETGRMLRSESWTIDLPVQRSIRCVLAFSYPAPDELDPALFAAPDLPAVRHVQRPAIQEDINQVSVNIRGLCMGIQIYAQEHDDQLPTDVRELARYAPGEDIDALLNHLVRQSGETVTVAYHAAEIEGRKLGELPPDMVLFDCALGDGVVRGFVDTHTEFVRGSTERP